MYSPNRYDLPTPLGGSSHHQQQLSGASTSSNNLATLSSTPVANSTSSATTEAKPSKPSGSGTQQEKAAIKRSAKACNHCRKGKARCDGFDSYPCRRCRESGVECVFEGIAIEELKQRANRRRTDTTGNDGSSTSQDPNTPLSSTLETRLRQIEQELDRLNAQNRKLEARIERQIVAEGSIRGIDRSDVGISRGGSTTYGGSPGEDAHDVPNRLARDAFESFWQHYAPLAPYISPTDDCYDLVKSRSPLLMHSIISVASRFQENREFVESNRNEALKLLRETLFAEKPITLDDLKAILLFSAWLGRGSPPGHSISLALQLDLPKSLERLLASIAKPPEEAAVAFAQLMPAVRIWLTLYAQDLWLSFAMGRRSMVTIDLSITNARLLLNFAGLRPVDARLIAQSELVTILGIVQETFLKMQHQTAETVHVVMQANSHLDNWIKTWGEWARSQEEASARYVLASLTMLLQGGRFYSNTLGLRDITKSEELLPIHMPCLRTALDAAVRIQGIHPVSKIAHAAEFTLITLSTSALFLLKMIKLTPHAFSTYSVPFYPAFPPPSTTTSPVSISTSSNNPSFDPSSPDVSASPDLVTAPSITQALEAVRHSAGLLASVPNRQKSYHHAVVAALQRLEGELATATLHASLGSNSSPPFNSEGGGGGSKRDEEGNNDGSRFGNGDRKRARDEVDHPLSRVQPNPIGYSNYSNEQGEQTNGSTTLLTGDPIGSVSTGGLNGDETVARNDQETGEQASLELTGPVDFAQVSIASLIGTDSFWSWDSLLPGEINAGLAGVV